MKIISKLKIHPFFYLFSLICIFNGLFKDFILIMFIILIHELGHILLSLYYKWNIKKIVILPFGGITIFECLINSSLKQELLIASAGPLFQSMLFFVDNEKLIFYNKLLLIFNLIPIIPLDGSKILNIIFNKIFSFRKSYFLTNLLSLILILVLIIYNNNLMELIIIFLLLVKIIDSLRKEKYVFNKFLFERYIYKFNFKKNKNISKINQMKKEYKHLFYLENEYKTEREILNRMFDK